MPGLEGHELDRLVERCRRQQPVLLEAGEDALALAREIVHRLGGGVRVLVEVLHEVLVVAGAADALHAGAVVLPDRPPLADGREQVPGQPVADVVRSALATEAAQMTRGAHQRKKILHRQRPQLRLPVPAVATSVVSDPVWALDVDLPLRMVEADVAGVARLRFARLLEAESVPHVAPPALPRRPVGRKDADRVTRRAREVRDAL